MRVFGRVVGISIALAVLSATSWGEVSKTTVGALAAASDVVVIGTVDRIVEMPTWVAPFLKRGSPETLHFARVSVGEWIQGAVPRQHVWYQADPTWACGMSAAVPKERVLLFLQRAFTFPREPGAPGATPGTPSEQVPIHRITGSGRGLMPIREIAGALHADVFGNVILPADVEVLPPDILAFEQVKGWARLDDLRRLLPARPPDSLSPDDADAHGLTTLLRQIEGRSVSGGIDEAIRAHELLSARLEEVRPHLLRRIADPRAAYRQAAALVLTASGVAPGLESKDVLERRAAAWALQTLATEEGADLSPVVSRVSAQVIADPDAEVRWRLLRALVPRAGGPNSRDLPDSRVRAIVLAGLADPSPDVKQHALEAMSAVERWVWNDVDAADDRRRALVSLSPLTVSTDLRTQRAAWAAVAALRGSDGEALLASRKEGVDGLDVVARRFVVASLGAVPGATAAGRLEGLLVHADPWVRGAAVRGLAFRGDPTAIGIMTRALLDADDTVAEGALTEIEILETQALQQAAVPGLEAALARAQDPGRRAHLARVLSELSR